MQNAILNITFLFNETYLLITHVVLAFLDKFENTKVISPTHNLLKNQNIFKIQQENTDNYLTFKFDKSSIHSNIKGNHTKVDFCIYALVRQRQHTQVQCSLNYNSTI